jgi:hypothetical protein
MIGDLELSQAHDAEEMLAKTPGDTIHTKFPKFTVEECAGTFTLRPPCLQEQILNIQITATRTTIVITSFPEILLIIVDSL